MQGIESDTPVRMPFGRGVGANPLHRGTGPRRTAVPARGGAGQGSARNERCVPPVGANHHGEAKRHNDLTRDANAASCGYVTLRFDYALVVHDWELVESAVLGALRSHPSLQLAASA